MKVSPERVQGARLRLAMTQAELAEKMGCSRRSIVSWETGEGGPVPRLLRQLSIVTGVSVPWLLGEEESNGQHRQDP